MEKYLINKEIGCGSFGKVFVVEAKSTGIQYVAKQIDVNKLTARQTQLATKEFHLLSKFNHPNIVRYKEAFIDEKSLHIVMELCELGDLHGCIQESKQRNEHFTDTQVMNFFVQICQAISYIHQQRVLHRDLKTKNIFLKKGNIIKLGDFGVSKMLENSFELAHTCIGSPFYISPEICENKPYDRKSDVWALGCVLFEIVTFKYAFQAKNMKSLLHKITSGQHAPFPSSTNPNIRQIVKKLLHENPRMRPNVSDILALPYVAQHNTHTHYSCKLATNVTKSAKSLPISKSCLNLKGNSISVPEDKYKSSLVKAIKINNVAKCQKQNNVVTAMRNNSIVKNAKEPLKIPKLPRANCLYYNLIEKNRMAEQERSTGVSKLDMDNAKGNFGVDAVQNIAPNLNLFSDASSSNKLAEGENEGEGGGRRKRWQTGTMDRRELINLLNDVQLQPSGAATLDTQHQTIIFHQADDRKSVEDLLFMDTAELSHVAKLPPILLPSQPDHPVNDATYVIHSQDEGIFERLEQRRMALERQLGTSKLLKIYKKLEDEQVRSGGVALQGNVEYLKEAAAECGVSRAEALQVWQLVIDDLNI